MCAENSKLKQLKISCRIGTKLQQLYHFTLSATIALFSSVQSSNFESLCFVELEEAVSAQI